MSRRVVSQNQRRSKQACVDYPTDGTSSLVTEGTGEEGVYKPSEHGGKKEDGTQDARVSSEHGFGTFFPFGHTRFSPKAVFRWG